MGTRHLVIVYHDGRYKLAQFGQWDGYPEGQGKVVLEFLADPANLTKLVPNLDRLYTPSEAEWAELNAKVGELKSVADERISKIYSGEVKLTQDETLQVVDESRDPSKRVCPSLSRGTGAAILDIIANADKPIPVQNKLEFVADIVFCEWTYVIDVDAGVLEVYAASRPVLSGTRFHELDCVHTRDGGQGDVTDGKPWAPSLVGKWPLSNLPSETEFLQDIKRAIGDREEQTSTSGKHQASGRGKKGIDEKG
uniref:Uncharacterized protein n=1 Tax=Cytospora leucostoma TaxID=1230097 RepID=A0A423VRP4_9PEZI|nr:hypothetical protein VPNG_08847 [Cytospora leucostoma]